MPESKANPSDTAESGVPVFLYWTLGFAALAFAVLLLGLRAQSWQHDLLRATHFGNRGWTRSYHSPQTCAHYFFAGTEAMISNSSLESRRSASAAQLRR